MTRLLFPYAGSKSKLAGWHVAMFPPARRYVSVFGGLAAEFLRHRPSGLEIWNDCDSDLHNMFAVIRNPVTCAELQRLLRWTPDGRRQFKECMEMLDDRNPVRRAWAFLLVASTGDMRSAVRKRTWYNSKCRLSSLPECLDWWHERLRRVKLECQPWQAILDRYDRDGTLLYLDPPYHPETLNSQSALYRYVLSAEEHVDLLLRLKRCRARVLICGYPHPTYDSILADWVQLEASCKCLMGSKGPRTERVWLNYTPDGGTINE